jgi:phage shock protein A
MADDTRDLTAAELQDLAVRNGRCPYCGRRAEDDEDKLFKELRENAASASSRANRLEQQVENLKDERDQLKVRNADLRGDIKELKTGG